MAKSIIGNISEKTGEGLRTVGKAVGQEAVATASSLEEQATGKATLFKWLYGGGEKMSDEQMKKAHQNDDAVKNEGVKKIMSELVGGNQTTEVNAGAQDIQKVKQEMSSHTQSGENPEKPTQDLPNPEMDPGQVQQQQKAAGQQVANPFSDNQTTKTATAAQISAARQDLFHNAQALGQKNPQEEEMEKRKKVEEEEMAKRKKEKEEKERQEQPVTPPSSGKKNAGGKMRRKASSMEMEPPKSADNKAGKGIGG